MKKKSTETSKKSKTSKKSTTSKKAKKAKKSKRKSDDESFSGIVIVDDDLSIDKEAELEERRAFLEEARSQEASSD